MPMPYCGAPSTTLPETIVSASAKMPIPKPATSAGYGPSDFRFRTRLSEHTTIRPTLLKVGDGYADGRPVHDIAIDDRALEGEFRIDARFAGIDAAVAGNQRVGGRIASNGGKGAIADVVVGDDASVGTEQVDAIAVLSGAAFRRANTAYAVAGDDRIVPPHIPAVNENAAVGAVGHGVVADGQPARLHRVQRRQAPLRPICGCRSHRHHIFPATIQRLVNRRMCNFQHAPVGRHGHESTRQTGRPAGG